MTPAEKLSRACPRQRAPRNTVPTRRKVWKCLIREMREAHHLSLRTTAEAVHLALSALHAIENGGDPQLTSARRIAVFFGCSTDDLWPGKAK